MQGVRDRSCLDGFLHNRWDIQSRTDQVDVLECRWGCERIQLGEKPWLEQ